MAKMNTKKVQGTNDSSIVSKLSMVNKGYFHDPFIEVFVEKSCNRSPLINRCYFARAAAISTCVENFLKGCNGHKQVVSLGAGFDTTYFRMLEKDLLNHCYFIEVDFPDVIRRKLLLATKGGLFSGFINDSLKENCTNGVFYRTDDYAAIGFDLQRVGPEFHKILCNAGVCLDKPTLFLSEVVLTYLPSSKSSKVIRWIADNFQNAVFTIFEQVLPYDSFGKVMVRHFNRVGSPLLAIHDYPSITDQVKRHKDNGFVTTAATTLCRYYYAGIDGDTRRRIEKLEVFDEFEAWHRACQHYVVLCSTNSENANLKNIVQYNIPDCSKLGSDKVNLPLSHNKIEVECYKGSLESRIQRYGQCCCVKIMEDREYAVVIGGFGIAQSNLSHRRLIDSVLLVDLESYCITHCVRSEDSSELPYPMYATSVCSRNGDVFIFGGRSSPNKCTNSITQISLSISSHGNCVYNSRLVSAYGVCLPKPRWRHSAALFCGNDDTDFMIIFGGRDVQNVFSDWWSYCISTNQWRKVESSIEILARHSSSLVPVSDKTCILCGGLGEDEMPFSDFFKVDFHDGSYGSAQITRLAMPMVPFKMYSQSCILYNGKLVLCGGILFYIHSQYGDEDPQDAINVLDIVSGEMSQTSISHQSPVLMHGHSCVESRAKGDLVVLGGGDNCFSFGTCFNESPISFKLNLAKMSHSLHSLSLN